MFWKKTVNDLIHGMDKYDCYILDDEDAIIVKDIYDGCDPKKQEYLMIHERLVDDKLVEINKWIIKGMYIGHKDEPMNAVIKDLNLFKVENGRRGFNAVYNYKEGKFIIPQNTWSEVGTRYHNLHLERYKGFLASFEIKSDHEEDDEFSYTCPITDCTVEESFEVTDGNYYAIIDIDGTIRGNKLFKGDSFSKITQIIDLDKYESLDAFKNERKQLCTDEKQRRKQEYHQLLESRNDGNISPYLDSEVEKVLNLKKYKCYNFDNIK